MINQKPVQVYLDNKMYVPKSLLWLLSLATITLAQSPEVVLPTGTIRGRTAITRTGVMFNVFEKIPYAAPPVGNLRFKPPQPVIPWEGVLDTVSYDVVCYQVGSNNPQENEDCLYINVYAPQSTSDIADPKPVMLYFYGGGFVDGSAQGNGPDFLIESGIVVVTINYRTGPFGFLSTQDEVIPGNNGLKDQHQAIKWTYDNIFRFGGDPNQITIFGHSAGSASTSYQLLNKNNEGLIKGAICQSGSFLSPWAFQRDARKIAFTTAALLNASYNIINDSSILQDYLLQLPAADLDRIAAEYAQRENPENRQMAQGFYWAPVIEMDLPDAFLTEKQYGKLMAGDIVKVPTLIGITSEEMMIDGGNIDALRGTMQQYDAHLEWLVPHDMRIEDNATRLEMGTKIRDIYTQGGNLADNLGSGIRYLSDQCFTRSLIKQAELQSKFTDVYFYQFSYEGPMGNGNARVDGAETVQHGEENQYLWHEAWSGYDNADPSLYPPSDTITLQRYVKILTNFAKYQNPTPAASDILQNIIWPTVNSGENADDFLYVDINNNLVISNHPKEATYGPWNELYDSLDIDDFDTY